MSVCIVVVTREHLSLRAEHREHAPLAVSRGYHIPGKVVGIPLRGAVRFHHTGDPAPLIQQVFRPVAVAVHNAGDPAPGVVGELEAVTTVRFRVVLVGPDQPHHLAVAIVGVFLPEILFAFPIAPPNMFRYLLLK